MLIDFGGTDALTRSLRWGADQRGEAWAIAIEQAASTAALDALEDRLHRRIDLLRSREVPIDVERDALARCAERRAELLAGQHTAASPAAPGGSPASHEAHGHTATAQKEQFEW